QADLPSARARRRDAATARAEESLRSARHPQSRKAASVTLRQDLIATGALVVEEGAGFRVAPPSIASLGRAVAVVRAWKLPLRVRGSADAPVHAPPKGVLLDLGSLDRIASVDGVTGIARVEAGCSVAALEAAARRAGSTLGPL